MKFTLEENRIRKGGKTKTKPEGIPLGGYDITVMVFKVSTNSPKNPVGKCEAAERYSTSREGHCSWFLLLRVRSL